MNVLISKLKEAAYSVLPITAIVVILHLTLTPLELPLLARFIIGTAFIILGLALFLFGVDIGITPIGNIMGSAIAKKNRLWIVVVSGLVLGFIISLAEPDLHILAGQVDFFTSGFISKNLIVIIVSIGIAVMLSLGLLRIVYNIPLHITLTVLYSLIFILSLFTSREFLAISFDASGATTGAMTVPFVLALAFGISSMKKDSEASEKDSFGLVAIASTGAIFSVMIMSIVSKTGANTASPELSETASTSIIDPFIQKLSTIAFEVFAALVPILLIFLLFQFLVFKLSRKTLRKIIVGMVFTFIGLVLFLVGVNAGFMDVGSVIGYSIASFENKAYLIIIGFIIGFVTIMAEPAVYVLIHQIEDVTSGYIKRKYVVITLSIGVGLAVALSMARILFPAIQLWHYLLPGFAISLVMTFFVPKIFVGMAFDSGGVASGPMTATFILAFANGATGAVDSANILVDGFGMIALVALMPIIALLTLGFVFKVKSKEEVSSRS